MTEPLRIGRRFFLRGAGGFTLALPVLPSLLGAREAAAQAAQNRKRFVHFFTEHGGIWGRNMFPADATLTANRTYAGHVIRRGALAATNANGLATVSPVLQASSTRLTPALLAKMNLLRGLDIPFSVAHYHGATLGNYASNNGDNGGSTSMQANPRRTIDQVLAWSPDFYPTLDGVRRRSLVVADPSTSPNTQLSYAHANPAAGTGAIQPVTGTFDSLALFDQLFPGVSTPGPAPRAPIIDRVLEDYRRLRDGNRRLSADDKRRLDEYLQRLQEVQRRVGTPSTLTCTAPTRPARSNEAMRNSTAGYDVTPDAHAKYFQLVNDVLVAGLQCGATRIAAIHVPSAVHTFTDQPGLSWHDAVAHRVEQSDQIAQGHMVAANRRFFSEIFVDLASRLDAVSDGDGKTLLDHSLLTWIQEHGNMTHQTQSVPVVSFGSAGGGLATGSYCDYRNLNAKITPNTGYEGTVESGNKYFGLTMNQWFGNVLQVLGVPRTAYQEPDHDGYGKRPTQGGLGDCCNAQYTLTSAYPQAVWSVAGERLPWLTP